MLLGNNQKQPGKIRINQAKAKSKKKVAARRSWRRGGLHREGMGQERSRTGQERVENGSGSRWNACLLLPVVAWNARKAQEQAFGRTAVEAKRGKLAAGREARKASKSQEK